MRCDAMRRAGLGGLDDARGCLRSPAMINSARSVTSWQPVCARTPRFHWMRRCRSLRNDVGLHRCADDGSGRLSLIDALADPGGR